MMLRLSLVYQYTQELNKNISKRVGMKIGIFKIFETPYTGIGQITLLRSDSQHVCSGHFSELDKGILYCDGGRLDKKKKILLLNYILFWLSGMKLFVPEKLFRTVLAQCPGYR